MLNEIFLTQFLLLVTLWFFLKAINVLTLWYLGGIYLLTLGILLLLNDADIFVGFLWVVDLGVGLIFFIFILHFSNFLYQKAIINVFSRYFVFSFFIFLLIFIFYFFEHGPQDSHFNLALKKNWFFFVSWYNFYNFYNLSSVSNLNLLREIYFYNNSFEFFIINFMLLYGIFTAILLSFLIKKIFGTLSISQFKSYPLLKSIESVFFIRNQNFIKQQNTSTGSRVWVKKLNQFKYDF